MLVRLPLLGSASSSICGLGKSLMAQPQVHTWEFSKRFAQRLHHTDREWFRGETALSRHQCRGGACEKIAHCGNHIGGSLPVVLPVFLALVVRRFRNSMFNRLAFVSPMGADLIDFNALPNNVECKINLFADMRRRSSFLYEFRNELLATFDFEFRERHDG